MALQVWLPLNGNINNQGLNPISMVGSPNSWGNGKIGKCATFSPTSTTPTTKIYNTTTSLNYVNEDFSWSVWINPSSTIYGTSYIFTVGRADAGGYGYGMGVSSGSVYCWFGNKNWIISITHNVWTHISFCRKGNTIKLYKNGVLDSTQTFSGTLPTYSDGNGLGLGCFHYSGSIYAYNGSINDFRIYNHCLSPKEVKEISKGLVLHYKMDDKIVTNLVKNNTYIIYNNYGVPASLTKLNETFQGCDVYRLTMTPNSTRISSFQTELGSHGVYGFHRTFKANTKYCFWIYYRPVSHSDVRVGGTASNISGWTEIPPAEYGGGWKVVGQYRNGSVTSDKTDNIFTSFYCPSAAAGTDITIDFCCPHLIEGFSEIIDNGDYQETNSHTTVYDCSGFGYNGTVNGTLITSSNTSRYNNSLSFNGSDSAITIGNFSTMVPDGNFTFNCWFHKDSWGSKGYETIFGGPSGFELECKNSSTNSPVIMAYSWGKGTKTYNLNEWNMLTMVRTSSDTKFYLNGELAITGTAGTIPSGNYFIGAWSTSTQQNYKGNVSDVRIYATPLSAEDVKELYSTSAMVCDNGTVMAYSLEE